MTKTGCKANVERQGHGEFLAMSACRGIAQSCYFILKAGGIQSAVSSSVGVEK